MTLAEINIEVDVGALFLLPLILLIGWFAARLLGVRQTWFRTFVTGFLGWIIGVLIAGLSVGNNPDGAELAVRVAIYSVLATMAVAATSASDSTETRRSRASATPGCSSAP